MNKKFTERDRCPLCLSPEKNVLKDIAYLDPKIWCELKKSYGSNLTEPQFQDINYVICECLACQLIYQKYVPNHEILSNIYSSNSEQIQNIKDPDFDIDVYLEYSREILTIINYLGKDPQECTVLDFGLGRSKWALVAKSIGCKVYGVEYSNTLIENAKKNGITMIQESELSRYHFDIINSEQVFEHLSEPVQTLQNLRQGLTQNGIIKISVPHSPNIKKAVAIGSFTQPKYSKYSLNPIYPLEHIQYFRHKSVRVMARKCDMNIIKIPLRNYYKFLNNWTGLRNIIKAIFKPLLINYTQKRNYFFLTRSN